MLAKGIPFSKRLFDLGLTIPGLLLLAPVLLVIAILVRIFHGKPILFRQLRPGYRGEPFYVYKFRTMTEERDEVGDMLADTHRLTRLGRFLRMSSLDELPELFQVLSGRMSLVGPRPLLMQYLDRYTPEQMRRHDVLPGITGLAQVNGRNALTWEDKFRFDLEYVDNWTLSLDIKILAMTLGKVLRREGINQPGRATADEFMGMKREDRDSTIENGEG